MLLAKSDAKDDRAAHRDAGRGPELRLAVLGISVGLLSFAALGTVAALWPNPFFVRMTPAGNWEIGLLSLQSALLGLYFAVRRPACSVRIAGLGGVVNFLGIACPVCNKILLVLFGWDALMTYFEPVRVYVAAVGVALTVLAVSFEWLRRSPQFHASAQENPVSQG